MYRTRILNKATRFFTDVITKTAAYLPFSWSFFSWCRKLMLCLDKPMGGRDRVKELGVLDFVQDIVFFVKLVYFCICVGQLWQ
jgi:hypothetical protein